MNNLMKENNFSDRFKAILIHFDVNIPWLTDKIGGSRVKFYNIINGATPNLTTAIEILNVFPEVSAEWLLRGEGPMLKDRVVDYDEVGELRAKVKALEGLYKQALKQS